MDPKTEYDILCSLHNTLENAVNDLAQTLPVRKEDRTEMMEEVYRAIDYLYDLQLGCDDRVAELRLANDPEGELGW